MIKKSAISLLVLASFGAVASNYYVKVPVDGAPSGAKETVEHGEWENHGAPVCGEFLPLPSQVNLGEAFDQEQQCQQVMTREVKYIHTDEFSGHSTAVRVETENKSESTTNTQSAVGQMNYILSTVVEDWEYVVSNEKFDCETLKDTSNIHKLKLPDYPSWEVTSYSKPNLKARQKCKSNQTGTQDTVVTWADGTVETTTENSQAVVDSYNTKTFNLTKEAFYSENSYVYGDYKTSSGRFGYTPYSVMLNGKSIVSGVKYSEIPSEYSGVEATVGTGVCCLNDSEDFYRFIKLK